MCILGVGGDCAPDISQAEPFLRHIAEKESQGRLKLMSVTKTDGRALGQNGYELFYTATVELTQDATYTTSNFTTWVYPNTNPPPGPAAGFPGLVNARTGTQGIIRSSVMFEKRESGWILLCTQQYADANGRC
jgi:hypothetical protein